MSNHLPPVMETHTPASGTASNHVGTMLYPDNARTITLDEVTVAGRHSKKAPRPIRSMRTIQRLAQADDKA